MSDILLDISRKIEPPKAEVLAAIDRAASKCGIPFFIVGGAARDFILQYGYGVRTQRVTLDVDIGVRVASWDQYSKITSTLLSDEKFKETEIEHRYESPVPQKIKVDILPVGEIEESKRTIRWRRGNNEMSMAGFDEAYAAAIQVKIIALPPTTIKVASLAGLALLKIVSWCDNPDERDRDAKDFKEIMYNYLEIYPSGSVYSAYPDIAGEDYELISARVLGRDMRAIAGPTIQQQLIEFLERERNPAGALKFILQMQSGFMNREEKIEKDIMMLDATHNGFMDS
jgi:predicted nucleotidyltransferase